MDLRRQTDRAQPQARVESNDAIVSRLAQQDKIPWYSKPNLRLLYFLMFPACFGVEMTTGFDTSLVNGLQSVSSWLEYFHYPRSALLGFIVAAYSLGFVTAALFAPFIVDRTGRRYAILLGGTISLIGAAIQGLALDVTMFAIARFILGSASVFSIVAAASLIAELSHPNERAVMSCLFTIPYELGAVAAAGVILGTFVMTNDWGWRIPSFLQAAPSLLQVAFIWFIPESPRWLVSKGRGNEAYAILVKYHAEGDESSDFARAEYIQIKETLEAEQKISETNWMEVLSIPGMRKRVTLAVFLGLSMSCSGIGLILYFLAPILDNIGIHDNRMKNLINLARVSFSLVISTIYAFTAPRYPRRRIFLTSTISLLFVFVAWTAASADYSFTHSQVSACAVLVCIFLFIPAYNLGFTVIMSTFLVELFPFHFRAKGLSIFQWCARTAGFVSHIVNPIGIDSAGWKWYIVYCIWNAFQVVFVYAMLPETSGRTLEELAFRKYTNVPLNRHVTHIVFLRMTSTVYDSDQMFRHDEVQPLCEHAETEACYGATENGPTAGL